MYTQNPLMEYISSLTFSLWSQLLSEKVVHNGTHADEALVAQRVPVHTAQHANRLTDLVIVNVLGDDVYQAQLSSSEDTCHKKV